MKKRFWFVACIALVAGMGSGFIAATAGEVARGDFGRLDHVFLIVMENETDRNILGNANVPFINAYSKVANRAANYFGVGHPSLPNYLEIVGGSNFGVDGDRWPEWIEGGCVDHAVGSAWCKVAVPPIASPGTDAAVLATGTQARDCNGQIRSLPQPVAAPNNCALHDYPAAPFEALSIADQLVASGRSWKAYEESLPLVQPGVAGVNYSDGAFSNLSPASVFETEKVVIEQLYAVKHNPFAYFKSVQLGKNPRLSLQQVKDFDGLDGLWADLRAGTVPNLSFIVPNQCHDMHGRVAGSTAICDGHTDAQKALLLGQSDAAVAKIINGIKASRSWARGRNAIVLVWDENDYANAANRVVMLVETNYADNGRVDEAGYDHFSLLRTLEAGFHLPCLNHACDATSKVMNEMFGAGGEPAPGHKGRSSRRG